ncbi:MAG: hypothetical protein JW800_07375 [Candidatus Omnitrophica bacterium]|nr:hypothetical protein [Candidatus Omnitrophota bacterium]
MKKIIFTIYVCTMITMMTTSAHCIEWQELSSDHFFVYYTLNNDFAKEVLSNAEKYYKRIAMELGYPRYSEFWTWDNRVKIYIYPARDSFLKATDQPEWSHGMADYTNKTISSFIGSREFIKSILPHEIAHLIFRDFVGFRGEIPLWLDEGVAQWAEEAKREEMRSIVKQLYEQDKLLLLNDMMELDIRLLKEMDRVFIRPTKTKEGDPGILFLSTDQLVSTYYLQSVALIEFLIERYGSMKFAQFCRELRDGKNLSDALRSAYPSQILSIEELDSKWREYLREK